MKTQDNELDFLFSSQTNQEEYFDSMTQTGLVAKQMIVDNNNIIQTIDLNSDKAFQSQNSNKNLNENILEMDYVSEKASR